jgi:HemY protein
MRWVFSFLLILLLAVALALFAEFNHGNIGIFWPPYRIDVSVNAAVVGLIATFLIGHVFLLAVARLINLPGRVQSYRNSRVQLSSTLAFRDAVLALFEGRFGRAERLADIAARDEKYQNAAALVAARATHRMREFERRDQWMKRDQFADGKDDRSNAHLMTVAELAIEERSEPSAREAIAAVELMQARGSRHIHGQRTALRAREIIEDWPEVIRLCRLLYKRNALHPTASRGLLARAHRASFKAFGDDLGALKKHWNQMSRAEQSWPEVVDPAAQAFARAGDAQHAVKLISSRLDAEFSGTAAELYSSMDAIPAKERLQKLEALVTKIGPDPALMKALGRVCLSLQLWGKAEDCLVRSAKDLPNVDTLLMLADVYESTDRQAQAFEVYRRAAKLSQATVA